MYKNQLQELAQRSCFNLPSYSCIREGPDHAPRFKATVNFNGETFESPTFCSTLRQAEHAAAEVALTTLACRGPSRALAARVLDETGVYKNLLQETAHRAGLKLPLYTTVRSGPGHVPTFKCTVELAGMSFVGEPSRTKKQAQKNAAMAAWSSLKRLVQHSSAPSNSTSGQQSSSQSSSSLEGRRGNEEQEQVIIARFLASLCPSESKNSKQVDSQYGQERHIPFCRELTCPTSSFYPMQYQSWVYPSFSPEMVLCQMWQQEQLLQLQHHLLTVQVLPTPVPGPQRLPYMRAAFSPDSHLSDPVRAQEPTAVGPRITISTSRPSLYISDRVITDPIRENSTVTIQEIHEEKTEDASECLPEVGSGSALLANADAEPRHKQLVAEDDKPKNSEQESSLQNVQRVENQIRRSEHPSSSNAELGRRPIDHRVPKQCSFDSSQPFGSHRAQPNSSTSFRHSSFAHPVMIRSVRPSPPSAHSPAAVRNVGIVPALHRPHLDPTPQTLVPPRLRTGVPSHSLGPYPRRLDIGGVHPRSLAPAVRIRSVIPVCSAPPARATPTPLQEGVLPHREKVDTPPENVASAGSEFDRLKI